MPTMKSKTVNKSKSTLTEASFISVSKPRTARKRIEPSPVAVYHGIPMRNEREIRDMYMDKVNRVKAIEVERFEQSLSKSAEKKLKNIHRHPSTAYAPKTIDIYVHSEVIVLLQQSGYKLRPRRVYPNRDSEGRIRCLVDWNLYG